MGARMKKKYQSGEAAKYISRAQALKKLQLNLKDFRRICILKGIYPREPNNRKKAQKGQIDRKTLYYTKDIRFLMHEPLLWRFREFKIFMRKIKTAREKGDEEAVERLNQNKPTLTLDHLVKERYPTFADALRDLDDCLSLCSLYATMPRITHIPMQLITLCRRLTLEFMHYVIEAKALRKVFISIKGIYYQVEVKGETITWVVPHYRGYQHQPASQVDYKIMTTFVDFYTTMLGFVNFRLYHSLNLHYPPKLATFTTGNEEAEKEDYSELVAALNRSLVRSVGATEEEPEIDVFDKSDDPSKVDDSKKEAEAIKRLQTLFVGLKVFIGREVPRESVVFLLRACGSQVSWDETAFAGATFPESDESITHQIIDRPSIDKPYLSRYYVQPQWVYDCINFRRLLPVEDYFVGAVLPPHVSPFVEERAGDYVPPERVALLASQKGEEIDTEAKSVDESDAMEEDSDGEDSEDEEDDDDDDESESEIAGSANQKVKGMEVKRGKVEKADPKQAAEAEEKEHYRFRELMMKKRHKRLYRSMMRSRSRREKEATKLGQKREEIEKEQAGNKSAKQKKPMNSAGQTKAKRPKIAG
nr:EOG090X05E6 [Triops cancriformis]